MLVRVSFGAVSFVEVRELRLHYQEWEPRDAPDESATESPSVVLVHGLGSSSHIWDYVAPELANHGLRVFALDQRGHSESDQPDTGYDFESIVADLDGFVDALGLTKPAVLVVHSWGASVVLHFAVAHANRVARIAPVAGGSSSAG